MVESWLPRFVDDLVVIQGFSQEPVELPKEVTAKLYQRVREAANLLRGETSTGTWNSFKWPVAPEHLAQFVSDMREEQALRADLALQIDLDGRIHEVGRYTMLMPSTRLSNLEQLENLVEDGTATEDSVAVFEPGSDSSYSSRLNDQGGE
jgi:hypothetical protein